MKNKKKNKKKKKKDIKIKQIKEKLSINQCVRISKPSVCNSVFQWN